MKFSGKTSSAPGELIPSWLSAFGADSPADDDTPAPQSKNQKQSPDSYPHASVLIVDDQRAVANAFASFWGQLPGIEVCAIAATHQQAIELAKEKQPDVVLLDIDLQTSVDGIDTAREVLSFVPHVRIVFLSGYVDPEYVVRAMALRTTGYLLKTDPREILVDGILRAAKRQSAFSPEVARVAAALGYVVYDEDSAPSPETVLSERERTVVVLRSQGKSRLEIAKELGIDLSTVRTLRQRATKKLNLASWSDGHCTVPRPPAKKPN